jgi:hypothetical protein
MNFLLLIALYYLAQKNRTVRTVGGGVQGTSENFYSRFIRGQKGHFILPLGAVIGKYDGSGPYAPKK